MRFVVPLLAATLVVGCAPSAEDMVDDAVVSQTWIQTFTAEYLPPLRGQSMARDGRFVFLFGPADESGPMTGEAGTYEISGDTVTNTVLYSTDPERIGLVYRWTTESMTADTVAYVVMNEAGEVTGRGRSVLR